MLRKPRPNGNRRLNLRAKNKMDMTITEQLQVIADKFCDYYCKYPAIYHEQYLDDTYDTQQDARDAMQKEQCENCPIAKEL